MKSYRVYDTETGRLCWGEDVSDDRLHGRVDELSKHNLALTELIVTELWADARIDVHTGELYNAASVEEQVAFLAQFDAS